MHTTHLKPALSRLAVLVASAWKPETHINNTAWVTCDAQASTILLRESLIFVGWAPHTPAISSSAEPNMSLAYIIIHNSLPSPFPTRQTKTLWQSCCCVSKDSTYLEKSRDTDRDLSVSLIAALGIGHFGTNRTAHVVGVMPSQHKNREQKVTRENKGVPSRQAWGSSHHPAIRF